MITKQLLEKTRPGEIIMTGLSINSPDGVYMTNSRYGDRLRWVVVRGSIIGPGSDWAAYIHWATSDLGFVASFGDKLSKHIVEKILVLDQYAKDSYRI